MATKANEAPKPEAKEEVTPKPVTVLSRASKIGDTVKFNIKGVQYQGEVINFEGPGAFILMPDKSIMAAKVG